MVSLCHAWYEPPGWSTSHQLTAATLRGISVNSGFKHLCRFNETFRAVCVSFRHSNQELQKLYVRLLKLWASLLAMARGLFHYCYFFMPPVVGISLCESESIIAIFAIYSFHLFIKSLLHRFFYEQLILPDSVEAFYTKHLALFIL